MPILADLLSTLFDRRIGRTQAPAIPDGRPLIQLAETLVNASGETSELALAQEFLSRYAGLEDAEKLELFKGIAQTMNIDPDAIRDALDTYERDPSDVSYRAFAAAVEPARQELIRRLNRAPSATGTLVKMRADLLRLAGSAPELKALDLDFRHLFTSWFNRGFLVLRPISWESPAHILEKIIAYEAVHAIDSWEDLRRRLEPADRRCFAFFHPAMPDEPLIFVEVALTTAIPTSVQDLLAKDRDITPEENVDTAVFYSISNCQSGLAGISFGNSLIKQVVTDLAVELPGLKTFVTLSPIPGLTRWLAQTGTAGCTDDVEDMQCLAAHYLLNAKKGDGRPFDPVAQFHLGNGAIIHAVHADADVSEKGRAQSCGTMVNYLYDLGQVSRNHENYATNYDVAASAQVRELAKPGQFPMPEEKEMT